MTPEDSLADLFADRKKHPLIVGRDRKMAWLGQVRLQAETGQEPEEYSATAAVWANSREDFDNTLRYRMVSPHLKLLRSEQVSPAIGWKGDLDIEEIRALISSLHEKWPIVFSELIKVEKDQIQSEEEEADYLLIETLEDIEPLDDQWGAWPLKNVPDALYQPLFGQPEATQAELEQYGSAELVPPLKTYAIIDAGKVMHGLTVISGCDLPWRCLFKGEVAQELQDVAPYLIELDAEADFTRRLMTYNPKFPDDFSTVHLWHKEPGIYIRSRAGFDALYNHFRKFTRIQDETGQSYYFRFWEPSVLVELPSILESKNGKKLFLKNTQFIGVCTASKTCGIIQRAD